VQFTVVLMVNVSVVFDGLVAVARQMLMIFGWMSICHVLPSLGCQRRTLPALQKYY
jgi:hypothetical protein